MNVSISSYENYMTEAYEEATKEMMTYIETKVKDTYYYRDHLQIPFISEVLAKSKTQNAIIDFTGDFIDAHSTQLNTSGPMFMFTFGAKETLPLYEMFGLTEKQVLDISIEMFKEAYEGISPYPIVKNSPHKILITAILVEAIQKNYEDVITCCKYLMAFAEYPLMFRKFWKQGVKEDVMNYTIEHLPNKFKVKKMSNLLALLRYDMDTVFNLCNDRLKTGLDYQYIGFMYRCRNQIKATFKKISNEYYNNNDKNASQHVKNAKLDDGNLADTEGYTSNVATLVENAYNKFLNNGVDPAISSIAAEGNQVDRNTLVGFLNQIYSNKENKLYQFIEDVITSYISRNPTNTSLTSGEFFNYGLKLYRSIGTSSDPLYKEIRAILNMWMYEIINITNYYQNKGTIINYTRAIFNYMMMMINHED